MCYKTLEQEINEFYDSLDTSQSEGQEELWDDDYDYEDYLSDDY